MHKSEIWMSHRDLRRNYEDWNSSAYRPFHRVSTMLRTPSFGFVSEELNFKRRKLLLRR